MLLYLVRLISFLSFGSKITLQIHDGEGVLRHLVDTCRTAFLYGGCGTQLAAGALSGLSGFYRRSAPQFTHLTSAPSSSLSSYKMNAPNVRGPRRAPGIPHCPEMLRTHGGEGVGALLATSAGGAPLPQAGTSVLNKGFHVTSHSADSGLQQ